MMNDNSFSLGLDEKEPRGKSPVISPRKTKLKAGLMEVTWRDYGSGQMRLRECGGVDGGQGHSEYRANVALVAFDSLHVGSVGQSCSRAQILFVLNL